MSGFLIVNPRSGRASRLADLLEAAERLDVETHVLRGDHDSPAELARSADADAIGMAGGDGSLAAVASVCMERGLRFVCVPLGTRNHFARDIGLDRRDPIAALAAFVDRRERLIDVGRVNDRVFLNNVSLGIYGRLVVVRERHRRRRDAFARLRALALVATHPRPEGITIDGTPVRARVVLVSNNEYKLRGFSFGVRERLDERRLYLYLPGHLLHGGWTVRHADRFTIDSRRRHLHAGVDGEPAVLRRPVELRIEPQALRVALPRSGSRAPQTGHRRGAGSRRGSP